MHQMDVLVTQGYHHQTDGKYEDKSRILSKLYLYQN